MKKYLIGGVVIVVLIVGVFVYRRTTKAPTFQFENVSRRSITQEVNVTGHVEPVENVSLSFETGGRVVQTSVNVGDAVTVGQILVRLNDAELQADLSQARAAVASAEAQLEQLRSARDNQQAKLDEVKKGARPEDIQVSQRKVANAEKALLDAGTNRTNVQQKSNIDLLNLYGDVPDILQDAYAKASDAVHHKTDALFDGDDTSSPKITFLTSDSQARLDSESLRASINTPLDSLASLANNPSVTNAGLDAALVDASAVVVRVRSLLDRLSETVDASLGISASTLTTYKSDLSTARTNVNTALSNINTHTQLIATQKVTNDKNIAAENGKVSDLENALALAQDELRLKLAGSTSEQIRAQEATVKQAELNITAQEAAVLQAQANVQNVSAKLAKAVLRSPIAGVVTKQDAKVGQSVSINVPLVEIISGSSFEMKASVPEADIAKIVLETPARVTLDAYGDSVVFDARVAKIDPAETVIEGVPTYTVTLHFAKDDERIKSGMTANIDMITATRENVLAIPFRAVQTNADRKFVRVVRNGKNEEQDVTTGLRGSDGYVEVLSGLVEGDQVVTVISG